MLNSDDPVTMHLLMETAMGDSQHYEVLPFEEADQLKKELAMLSSRLDATKRKLAIESKVKDTASSMNRLNGPSKSGQRDTGSRGDERTDDEFAMAHQKCEDLAQELWQLEKGQQEVQKRLLEHTAGILQMTHKGFLEKDAPAQMNGMNGSMDGYGALDIGHFDESSFYQTLDSMLDEGHTDGARTATFEQQTEAIMGIERKIWDLNRRLRDAITQASSGRLTIPTPPDPEDLNKKDPSDALQGQVAYLERGIEKLQRNQIETVQYYTQSARATEDRLEDLNTQLRGIVLRSSLGENPQHPLPPEVTGKGADEQVSFLENGLDALEQGVSRLKEDHHNLSTRAIALEEKAAQSESTLQKLTATVTAHEERADQHNDALRNLTSTSAAHEQRLEYYESTLHGLWQNMSEGEKFSMDAFSFKVSSLNTRVRDLNEQKDILNRQVQQQRELNSKSDSEKDAKLTSMTVELEQAKIEGEKARKELHDLESEMVRLQTEVTVARAELDGAYGTRAQRAAEVAQHPALQQEISDLKQELDASKAKSDDSGALQQRVQTLQQELSETIAEYEIMTKSSIDFEKERETLENNVDALRDRCEALETQVNEEKVNKLGMKSPGVPGDRSSLEKGATSTSVLKTEFKKMMRETRAENMRALRVRSPLF